MGAELDATGTAPHPPGRLVHAFIRAARPQQWVKNLLLLAAPLAAGAITHEDVFGRVCAGIAGFCLISSGTYLLNDVHDAEEDRRHPRKRFRPIASGELPVRTAAVGAIAMMALGLAACAAVSWWLLACAVAYLALSTAYSFLLRTLAIWDLITVATLFLLRAIAGGAAADVTISRWFLLVVGFSSLAVIAGKRQGELAGGALDADPDTRRPTLEIYSVGYLRFVWTFATAISVAAYCLWAFSRHVPEAVPWFVLSIVPLVIGILRYALLVDKGAGETPERMIRQDKQLLLVAVAWAAIFVCGALQVG